MFPQRQDPSAAPEEGALTQIPNAGALQRQNFPFFLSVSHPHLTPFVPFLSCLSTWHPPSPSGNLYYFILLQSLLPSIISASSFRSTCLWHWPHYSIAVQGRRGGASTHSFCFFLSICKVFNPKASGSHDKNEAKLYFPTRHVRKCTWSANHLSTADRRRKAMCQCAVYVMQIRFQSRKTYSLHVKNVIVCEYKKRHLTWKNSILAGQLWEIRTIGWPEVVGQILSTLF